MTKTNITSFWCLYVSEIDRAGKVGLSNDLQRYTVHFLIQFTYAPLRVKIIAQVPLGRSINRRLCNLC